MVRLERISTDKGVINRGRLRELHLSGETVVPLNSKQVLAINYSPDTIEWIYFHASQTPPAAISSSTNALHWGKTGKTQQFLTPGAAQQVCHKGAAGLIIGVFGHMQISAISSW